MSGATLMSCFLPSVTTINSGKSPLWSIRQCILTAPFRVRNFAHGKTFRQRSMRVESMVKSGFLNFKEWPGLRYRNLFKSLKYISWNISHDLLAFASAIVDLVIGIAPRWYSFLACELKATTISRKLFLPAA